MFVLAFGSLTTARRCAKTTAEVMLIAPGDFLTEFIVLDRSRLDKTKPISRRPIVLAAMSPLFLLGILVLAIGLAGFGWPNWSFVIPLLLTIAGGTLAYFTLRRQTK
jgi:hypothetical protein